jgi:hypothetical protein
MAQGRTPLWIALPPWGKRQKGAESVNNRLWKTPGRVVKNCGITEHLSRFSQIRVREATMPEKKQRGPGRFTKGHASAIKAAKAAGASRVEFEGNRMTVFLDNQEGEAPQGRELDLWMEQQKNARKVQGA